MSSTTPGPIGPVTTRVRCCCLVILAGLLLPALAVNAQDPPEFETLEFADEYKMPEPPASGTNDSQYTSERNAVLTRRRTTQRQITDILKGRGGNTSAVDTWFNGFVFPEMTQTDNDTLSRLGENRQRFFRFYLEDTTNQALRNQVIDLTVPVMKRIAEGNFHPAARVNAMLLLGRLNTREGNRSGGVIPQPVPDMTSYLLLIATSPDQPEYLRISALTGLVRHASLRRAGTGNELGASDRRQIGDAMVNLIGQSPSDEISREAVYWMKRRAIQVLGNLGMAGDNGRYARTLRDLVTDEDEDLMVRTEAARAYAGLNFNDPADARVGDMTEAIGKVIIAAADSDAQYLVQRTEAIRFIGDFLDKAGKGKQDGGGGGALTGASGAGGRTVGEEGEDAAEAVEEKPKVPEVIPDYHRNLVRQRFKSHLWSGKVALVGSERSEDGGLWRYASDDDQTFIRDMIESFDNLMVATDLPDEEEDDEPIERDPLEIGDKKPEKPPTLAERLKRALDEGATDINATITKHRPTEEAAGAETPPAAADGEGSDTAASGAAEGSQ